MDPEATESVETVEVAEAVEDSTPTSVNSIAVELMALNALRGSKDTERATGVFKDKKLLRSNLRLPLKERLPPLRKPPLRRFPLNLNLLRKRTRP